MTLQVEELQATAAQINTIIDEMWSGRRPTPYEHIGIQHEVEMFPGNPVFLVVGPSGVGKTTFANRLTELGIAQKVQTATTRERKVDRGESEVAYRWLDGNKYDEEGRVVGKLTGEELIERYGLLECQEYAGNFYGLPKDNLDKAIQAGPSVIVCENEGVKAITEHLKGKATLVVIQILPENIEQLMSGRMTGRENNEARIRRVIRELTDMKVFANLVVMNQPVVPELAETNQIPALNEIVLVVQEIIARGRGLQIQK